MTKNMGTTDRALRLLVAAVAVAGAVATSGVAATLLLAVAAIMVITSAVGFCPLYRLVGVSTCRVPRRT